MSEVLTYHAPLAVHFESRMLSELPIIGNQLVVKSAHQPLELPKTGLQKWLAKLPKIGDDSPVPMDIDLSCGLYNDKGELLEVVWYGKVRSLYESVRHHGDTFIGMNKAYRPSMVEESLSIRIWELDEQVSRLAVFVHSHNLQDLNLAPFGNIYLSDNEGKLIHETPFASFEEGVTGVCAWQFVKMRDGDWRVSAPMSAVKAKNSAEIAKKWHGLGD